MRVRRTYDKQQGICKDLKEVGGETLVGVSFDNGIIASVPVEHVEVLTCGQCVWLPVLEALKCNALRSIESLYS